MSVARPVLLLVVIGLMTWSGWPRQPIVHDTYVAKRQYVIRSVLERHSNPVVILGDSITEASTLPQAVCGRPIVNAGIGGLSTTTALRIDTDALFPDGNTLIVIALGTNDAAIPNTTHRFRANLLALSRQLKPRARSIALAQIPPPEAGLPDAARVERASIDAYNASLTTLAAEIGADLIALPEMPPRHTSDGLHLNAAGYAVWDRALMKGIEAIVCTENISARAM